MDKFLSAANFYHEIAAIPLTVKFLSTIATMKLCNDNGEINSKYSTVTKLDQYIVEVSTFGIDYWLQSLKNLSLLSEPEKRQTKKARGGIRQVYDNIRDKCERTTF